MYLLFVAIVTLGCGSRPAWAQTPARWVEQACPFEVPEAEQGSLHCTRLPVAEDPARPLGHRVELAMVVLEPTVDRGAGLPPILFLPGGPGLGRTAKVPEELQTYAAARAAGRRVVVLDVRGSGQSTPSLDCPALAASIEDVLSGRAVDYGALAEDCLADLGGPERLRHYGSDDIARDLVAVADALQVPRVGLWANAGSTPYALELLRHQGHRVSEVVFDSPVPSDVDVFARVTEGFDLSLSRLDEDCRAQRPCAERLGSVHAAYERTAARLEATSRRLPLYTGPGAPLQMRFGRESFDATTATALMFDPLLPMVPASLHLAAHQGDLSTHALAADILILVTRRLTAGLQWALVCQEFWPWADLDAYRAATLTVGADADDPRSSVDAQALVAIPYQVCPELALQPTHTLPPPPPRWEGPALVLTGRYDPVSSPAWAHHLGRQLPGAQVVEIRGGSVVPGQANGCGRQLVGRFLADPAGPLDTACADVPLRFVTGLEGMGLWRTVVRGQIALLGGVFLGLLVLVVAALLSLVDSFHAIQRSPRDEHPEMSAVRLLSTMGAALLLAVLAWALPAALADPPSSFLALPNPWGLAVLLLLDTAFALGAAVLWVRAVRRAAPRLTAVVYGLGVLGWGLTLGILWRIVLSGPVP